VLARRAASSLSWCRTPARSTCWPISGHRCCNDRRPPADADFRRCPNRESGRDAVVTPAAMKRPSRRSRADDCFARIRVVRIGGRRRARSWQSASRVCRGGSPPDASWRAAAQLNPSRSRVTAIATIRSSAHDSRRLLLSGCSTQATAGELAAPSRMEQSAEVRFGRSRLVPSGVDAGGCSATRASARCACKSPRIGRRASTFATPAIAAKRDCRPIPPEDPTVDHPEMRACGEQEVCGDARGATRFRFARGHQGHDVVAARVRGEP
jgi:hypothetical protein